MAATLILKLPKDSVFIIQRQGTGQLLYSRGRSRETLYLGKRSAGADPGLGVPSTG